MNLEPFGGPDLAMGKRFDGEREGQTWSPTAAANLVEMRSIDFELTSNVISAGARSINPAR
jgi:hypothetical protein